MSPPKRPDAGYKAIHKRLSDSLGPARNYQCVDCGKQAAHWSYEHGCADERVWNNWAYCPHPEHYRTRCVLCHAKHDGRLESLHAMGEKNSKAKAARTHCKHKHEYTEENTWVDKTGARHCRTCRREALRRFYARRKSI